MFAILGEALMDMVITKNGGELSAHFGGGPFNTALALSRLNEEVCFHYPLSQDYYGRRFQKLLDDDNITYSCPYISPRSTPLAMVHLDETGKADYRFYRHNTAERDLRLAALKDALPKNIKALHTGTLAIAEQPDAGIIADIIELAKSRGAVISIDPNIRERSFDDKAAYRDLVKDTLYLADIIKCSDDDASFLYPDMTTEKSVGRLFDDYKNTPLIVVTGGGKFIKAQSKQKTSEIKPQAKTIAGDTIGAGDCFIAGLLHQCNQLGLLFRGGLENITMEELENILHTADKVAGLNCQNFGCQPPNLVDLNRA